MGHLLEGGLRSSGTPRKGFVESVMNDGPRFHSNMPVSELTERVTQAIEASNISSTPQVSKTMDGATITGAQGKFNSHGDRTRGRRTIAQILGTGYTRKQETLFSY